MLVLLELAKDFEADMYDQEERKKFEKNWKKVVDGCLKSRYKEVVELVKDWKDENGEYVVEVILGKLLKELEQEND